MQKRPNGVQKLRTVDELLVVARKHDIDEALAPCAAQMLTARPFNEREGTPKPFLYGCVTNGDSWHVLKLQGNELQPHPERFGIDEISKILWFLVECLKDVDQLASEAA